MRRAGRRLARLGAELGTLLGLLAAAATPAAASILASPESEVASRLLIAVPTLDDPALAAEPERFAEIRAALAAFAAGPPEGGAEAVLHLEVEVAFGNPYQVLAWMEDGRVDGAVATPLVAQLLQAAHPGRFVRPGWPLRADETTPGVVRTYAPWARAWRHQPDGTRVAVAAAEAFDEVLFDALYRAAAQVLDGEGAEVPARQPAPNRLLLPTHLSSAAFAALLSRSSALLAAQLSGVPGRPAVEEAYWRHVFGVIAFGFGGSVRDDAPARDAARHAGPWLEVELAGDGFSPAPAETQGPAEPSASGQPAAPVEPTGVEAGAGWQRIAVDDVSAADAPLADQLLLDQAVAHELMPADSTVAPSGISAVSYFERKLECDVCQPLRHVLAGHYGRLGDSPARAFSFTLPEAMALLAAAQRNSRQPALALLLPGGGVKASYQSVLADRLYDDGWVHNELAPPPAGAAPSLPVRYVVGNSGGALLGFFVARLTPGDPRRLRDLLWTVGDQTVDSLDIFGSLDMMRWATGLACFTVFCGVLAVMSRRRSCPFPAQRPTVDGSRRWGTSFALAALLGVMPFALKYVKGDAGVEHVPAIEGMFYFSFLFLALSIDNRLVRRNDPALAGTSRRDGAVVLIVLGALAALVPVVVRTLAILHPPPDGHLWLEEAFPFSAGLKGSLAVLLAALVAGRVALARWASPAGPSRARTVFGRSLVVAAVVAFALLLAVAGDTYVPAGALVFCLGILAVLLGIMALCRQLPHRYGMDSPWPFLLGLAVPMLALAVVYTAVAALVAVGALSWLELTADLWLFLLSATLLVSVILYSVARRMARTAARRDAATPATGESPAAGPRPGQRSERLQQSLSQLHRHGERWLCEGFAFLCSRHPAGGGRPRYQRIFGFFALGFLGWNFIQAPALYGNERAQAYLSGIADRFEASAGPASDGGIRFQATFAVPANSLATSEERYFVFSPADVPCTDEPGDDLPTAVRKDSRWRVFRGVCSSRLVRELVFASGSPFPIFPPHFVSYPAAGVTVREPLVDGGYAHNVPIEAVRRLGARQVLLLHSSNPWPAAELAAVRPGVARSSVATIFSANRFLGQMTLNLGRLVPFLFARAQMTDQLSRENLLVVSLAPLPDPAWPPLFDFRRSVVDTLRHRADEDLAGRLARVENWDSPLRQLSVTARR